VNSKEQKIFRTTDAPLSTFIFAITGEKPIVAPNPKRQDKVEFHFSACDDVYRAAAQFAINASVGIQDFLDCQRMVRDEMKHLLNDRRKG
jgi:hypothetical protein